MTEKNKSASAHARALSRLGAAKGGRARSAAMSPEERQDLARVAAQARWGERDIVLTEGDNPLPRATHVGTLPIGNVEIPCAVLDDGRRVLTQAGFLQAIGRADRLGRGMGGVGTDLPPFLDAANLKDFISEDLRWSSRPVVYKALAGGGNRGVAHGYVAELLPNVCRVFLDARDAGALLKSQEHIARACDLLVRGLSTLGIIALIDECTGYQYERDRNELRQILSMFIAAELLPWAERFPKDFYRHMFRLRGWPWSPVNNKRTQYAGVLTNQLIYERLPPGVLEELRRKNPKNENGNRNHKHHQYLTREAGHPVLDRQIIGVTFLMKGAETWADFEKAFKRACADTPEGRIGAPGVDSPETATARSADADSKDDK